MQTSEDIKNRNYWLKILNEYSHEYEEDGEVTKCRIGDLVPTLKIVNKDDKSYVGEVPIAYNKKMNLYYPAKSELFSDLF